jgi:hypothetical protein
MEMIKRPELSQIIEPLARAVLELEDACDARARAACRYDDNDDDFDWRAELEKEDARVQQAHVDLVENAVHIAVRMAKAILRRRALTRQALAPNTPIN